MIDPAELKTEITTDPKKLGLPALAQAGNHQGIADAINASDGAGAETISLASIIRDDFLLGIVPAVLAITSKDAATQAKWDRILTLITAVSAIKAGTSTVKALLAAAVSDGLLTPEQIESFTTRTGSRTEKLFGAGSTITAADVALALRELKG